MGLYSIHRGSRKHIPSSRVPSSKKAQSNPFRLQANMARSQGHLPPTTHRLHTCPNGRSKVLNITPSCSILPSATALPSHAYRIRPIYVRKRPTRTSRLHASSQPRFAQGLLTLSPSHVEDRRPYRCGRRQGRYGGIDGDLLNDLSLGLDMAMLGTDRIKHHPHHHHARGSPLMLDLDIVDLDLEDDEEEEVRVQPQQRWGSQGAGMQRMAGSGRDLQQHGRRTETSLHHPPRGHEEGPLEFGSVSDSKKQQQDLILLKREAFQELASQTQRFDDLFIAKMIYWESLGPEEKAQWLQGSSSTSSDQGRDHQENSHERMDQDEIDELVHALECRATVKDYSALIAFEEQQDARRQKELASHTRTTAGGAAPSSGIHLSMDQDQYPHHHHHHHHHRHHSPAFVNHQQDPLTWEFGYGDIF